MKKGIILVIFLFICLFFFPLMKAQALQNRQTLAGNIIFEEGMMQVKELNGSDGQLSNYYSLTLPSTSTAKVATWSYAAKYHTTLVTLDKIAKDYEENHPGWIVVGGINAEGYHSSGGYNEISNLFVQDYNLMRTGVSSEAFKELIGFYDDNSHIIKRTPKFSDNLILSITNKDGTLSKYEVPTLNELPDESNIALITQELSHELDLTGYYVAYGNYKMYRRNTFYIPGAYPLSKTDNGIYLEGELIGSATTQVVKPNDYRYYIVTKDKNTYDAILNGSYAKCQYEFLDEFANCKSIVGYMYKLVENGKVKLPTDIEDNSDDYKNGNTLVDDSFQYNCDYYNTHNKERSCIGFKDDGSIVLFTANKAKGGPCQYELGVMLKNLGCKNAYQFDGGGSVTFTMRDEYGNFKNYNTPADGSYRSISTGIFFVVRDPSIKETEVTRDSITFDYPDDGSIRNVKAVLNGITYSLDESKIVTGLLENTNYSVYFTYEELLEDNTYQSSSTSPKTIKTKEYFIPNPNINITNISKHGCLVTVLESNNQFQNIIIELGDRKYEMTNNSLLIDDLLEETTYPVTIYFENIDPTTNKIYEGKLALQEIKTLKYEIPSISNFELSKQLTNGSVRFSYRYEDLDHLVSMALISDDKGNTYLLDTRIGDITIKDITSTTSFTLQLIYSSEEGEKIIKTTPINVVVEEKIEEPITQSKKKCGKKDISLLTTLVLASFSMLFFIYKKEN